MGDTLRGANSISEARATSRKKQSITYLAVSASKVLSQKTCKSITLVKRRLQGSGIAGDVVLFLAMTAGLEVVRRFSKAKCPFVWRALQALQVLHFPPFKWLQRWLPFKEIAKHTEKLSRPMMVLSIATLFSDEAEYSTDFSNGANQSREYSSFESGAASHRSRNSVPADWLLRLNDELKNQGINLPDRLGEDELGRFYAAVNGDFKKLVSAVKKTINWRQSYELLQPQELQAWSHLIFWHGRDIGQRPCLILRLGPACSNLQSIDMGLFVKAVVSQIEHGVLNLVMVDQPQIMVLMDCLGLSPLGFPINTMRSCATLLQDHYPNRLGCLMITRLPRIARVVTQTLFQVLRPSTRRKVRTLGRNYLEVLSERLDSIPSSLGGNCACSKCLEMTTIQDPNGNTSGAPLEHVDEHVLDRNIEIHHVESLNDEGGENLGRIITITLVVLCAVVFVCVSFRVAETFYIFMLEKLRAE